MPLNGGSIGEYFIWLVQSSGGIEREKNGSYRTIFLRKDRHLFEQILEKWKNKKIFYDFYF